MLSSYNLKNKQTIQISGLILQYCSATTLYRRLSNTHSVLVSTYLQIEAQSNICMRITVVCRTADLHRVHQIFVNEYRELKWFLVMVEVDNVDNLIR